jgi:hypothetical protein
MKKTANLFFILVVTVIQSQAQCYFSKYKGEVRKDLNILGSEIAVSYVLSIYSNDSLVYISGREDGSNFGSIKLNGRDEEILIDLKDSIIYKISDSLAYKIIPETLMPLKQDSKDSRDSNFCVVTKNDSLTITLNKELPKCLLPGVVFTNNCCGVSEISCKRYSIVLSSYAPASFDFSGILEHAKKVCKMKIKGIHLM